MGHDLPLPQMSATTGHSATVMEEDHNVGSLLRLVYSCPDQLDQQGSQSEYIQPQTQNHTSSSSNNNDLMEYATAPILDGISLDYL